MTAEAVKAVVSNAATTGIYSTYDKYLIGGIIALSIFLILVSGFDHKLERWFQKRVRGKKDYDEDVAPDADGIVRAPREASSIRSDGKTRADEKPVTRRRAKKTVEATPAEIVPPEIESPKPRVRKVKPAPPVSPLPPETQPKKRPARKKPAA